MKFFIACTLLLAAVICSAVEARFSSHLRSKRAESPTWTYNRKGDTGPKYWPDIDSTCSGTSQSPIDITVKNTRESNLIPPVTFKNFGVYFKSSQIKNLGHGPHVFPKASDLRNESRFPYFLIKDVQYDVAQYHFHWGVSNNLGSEHTFSGNHYPLELHIVGQKHGLTAEEADHTEGGLAVLSVMYKVGNDPRPLAHVAHAIKTVNQLDDEGKVHDFTLAQMMPRHLGQFFRYRGSFTTPSCWEGVIWTIFEHEATLTQRQLDLFRQVHTYNNETLKNPFRPTQPLNGRTVYAIGHSLHGGRGTTH